MKRRYYKQEKANTCQVASLRTVLAIQFDVRIPEVALEALGTLAEAPIRKFGTGVMQLRRMIKGANEAYNTGKPWTLRIVARGTLAQLRKATADRPALVRVYAPMSGTKYHAIVVLRVNARTVRLFDPDGEPHPVSVSHERFLSEWLCPEGYTWFATIGGGSQHEVCSNGSALSSGSGRNLSGPGADVRIAGADDADGTSQQFHY